MSPTMPNTRHTLCLAGCVALLLVALLALAPAALADAELTAHMPVTNALGVPLDSTVVLTYSAEMSATTVTSTTVAVHSMMQGLVTETHSTTGEVVTVTPSRAFHPGEIVYTTATTHTADITGTHPVSPTVWQFTALAVGGTGRYGAAAHDSFGAGTSRSMALGDLDGDGDLDAVITNSDAAQEVWLNDGSGDYGSAAHDIFGAGNGNSVALGDVDGDGDLDVVDRQREPGARGVAERRLR